MQIVSKICEKHGILDEKDIIKEKSNQYEKGFYLRCAKCKFENSWKYQTKCKKHGELGPENIKANGRCKICHRESANKKRNENREWFNKKMAEDRINNPEKWQKIRKREYERSVKNIGRAERVKREILRVKGLNHADYEKMFEEQNHKCKICNKPETRAGRTPGTIARLVVDHCHDTNIVRGLLCHKCNIILGYCDDSLEILHSAIMYLEESGKKFE